MSVIDELVPLLKKLRLSGVLQSLELRLREAAEDNLGYEEFLYRLVKDEVERRDAKQLDQRVRRANFEHQKTLEDFDFHFNPQVPKAKVLDLATRAFVERRENVLPAVSVGTRTSGFSGDQGTTWRWENGPVPRVRRRSPTWHRSGGPLARRGGACSVRAGVRA